MKTLYWQIGRKIINEILKNKRADYGDRLIVSLAQELQIECGKGWSEKHLRHCIQFAEIMPEMGKVSALRRQLSWTHIKTLINIDDELKRSFYIEMCKIEKWSTRTNMQ